MRAHRWTIVAALLAAALLVLVALAGCGGSSSGSGSSGSGSSGSGSSASGSGGSTSGSAVAVSLKDFAFDPAQIAVPVGGTVTFTNNDSTQHNVTGDTWSSGPMDPGKTYSHTFTTAGTFPIHCSIHPSMTASVVVK